jgi:hypothetical protein
MAILGLPSSATAMRRLPHAVLRGLPGWLAPLALLQRALWRREWRWLPTALACWRQLCDVGPERPARAAPGHRTRAGNRLPLDELTRGLDGCWLALIVFCALHAVAVYYLSLQRVQLHLAQAQAAARDAELRALRLQVNPHFLFNSLNAISALVSSGANREANRMIGAWPTSCAPRWPTTAATSTRWPRNWRCSTPTSTSKRRASASACA